jgi:hypothetical protein
MSGPLPYEKPTIEKMTPAECLRFAARLLDDGLDKLARPVVERVAAELAATAPATEPTSKETDR